MATDDECLRIAHEYARLAGLTKQRNVQDQLLDLARGWTAVARHERRSDGARVQRFTTATTSTERPRSKTAIEAIKLNVAQCRLWQCSLGNNPAAPVHRLPFPPAP